ncbi:MAG: GGDEF domain-containing protein [Pseudomonadota bacterium]
MLPQQKSLDESDDDNPVEFEYNYAKSLSEEALEIAENNSNPPYPMVYEVLFAYASGHNPELNKAVDRIISAGKKLTNIQLEEIYKDRLDPLFRMQQTQFVAGQQLDGELDDLGKLVDNYMIKNQGFNSALSNTVQDLESINTSNDLKTKIVELIHQNERMHLETMDLTKSLEKSKEQIHDLRMCLTAAVEEAMKDQLTGLGNRRWLERNLEFVLSDMENSDAKHCIALIDLDHFKSINDRFGHLVGDKILKFLGEVIEQNVRDTDICARFGGEEFCIVLKGLEVEEAGIILERIRIQLAESNLILTNSKKPIGSVTASFGLTALKAAEKYEDLIERVDQLLYSAKNSGKNCIVSG